ncbi:MAG: response regulator [Zymomonas mobilis]|uniref:histidine kinase n=1 Tax=Zymomonas mobilis TaxID=542 RepID=A0A542W0H8_ZYMMB|nr:response regulator [Zymomonas mobilis]TQL17070.1 two-component system cell cycle sensor histidine kinase/response regulator CckA [Zymomonas mobilis]
MKAAIFSYLTGIKDILVSRWLVATFLILSLLAFFLFGWVLGDYRLLLLSLAAYFVITFFVVFSRRQGLGQSHIQPTEFLPDLALLHSIIDNDIAAVAVSDRSGQMLASNSLYNQWFPSLVLPDKFDLPPEAQKDFDKALRLVWRNGGASLRWQEDHHRIYSLSIRRAGVHHNYLIWRILSEHPVPEGKHVAALVEGGLGRLFAEAGIMAVLLDEEGRIVIASPVFTFRSTGQIDATIEGHDFLSFFQANRHGQFFFKNTGEKELPIRFIKIDLSSKTNIKAPFYKAFNLVLLLDEAQDGDQKGQDSLHIIGHLLPVLPYNLAVVGLDGQVLLMNPSMSSITGMSLRKFVMYPSDWVVQEDKAAVADAVRRYSSGRSLSGEISVRLIAKPEETVTLTLTGIRHLGEVAVLITLQESTTENEIKQQMAQTTRMQAIGQLAGGVAHDFNNILTAIIGYCDVMRMRHVPGDSDYDDIQQIRHNSNRAAALTRQLLAFSRQQTMRPQILQLPDVISEISNLLKRLLGEKILLTVKHGRNLGLVRADPGQLEQVIVNLAVNARDAMLERREERHLTIQTYRVTEEDSHQNRHSIPAADYTALAISDTGSGIPPEILNKIFEPFFTTKEVGKGTGLGLATVYGIVRQSGGFIFADSEAGVGTCFTIYLPIYEGELPQKEEPKQDVNTSSLVWGSGKILLVEDEETVRNVASFGLVRQGYEVLTAENGEEALSILKKNSEIDLLISDVVMPGMDGPSLGSEARKLKPNLPVLFISGYAEEQLRRSISLEHVAFLPKPFSIQDLAVAVSKVLKTST